MKTLDERKVMSSQLWLDQPDAPARIDERLGQGEISSEQAEKLHHFVEQGFLSFHLQDEPDYEALEAEVDQLWQRKPADLAYAYQGPLKSMADSDESRDRRPSYRIADLHSHSSQALNLYLHPEVFSWLDLVFGEPSVAFQSLYFQYGSQQSLHRDPVYVVTTPPSHLVATWTALEDIGPDCGPLCYVPGSHKLPYFEFSPDRIAIRPEEDYLPAYDFTREECQRRGLEEKSLTCRRGEVFLWHGNLVHGGSPVNDPELTRRSFVVHYSTRAHYQSRGGGFLKNVAAAQGEEAREFGKQTSALLENNGCAGFQNPLKGFDPSSLSQGQRIEQGLRRKLRQVVRRVRGR